MPKAQIRYSNSSEKVEKSHNFNKTERVSVIHVLSLKTAWFPKAILELTDIYPAVKVDKDFYKAIAENVRLFLRYWGKNEGKEKFPKKLTNYFVFSLDIYD